MIPPRCPARNLVTTPTDVARLIKKNSTFNFMIIFSTEMTRAHSETESITYFLLHDSPQTPQKPVEMYSRPHRFLSENNYNSPAYVFQDQFNKLRVRVLYVVYVRVFCKCLWRNT